MLERLLAVRLLQLDGGDLDRSLHVAVAGRHQCLVALDMRFEREWVLRIPGQVTPGPTAVTGVDDLPERDWRIREALVRQAPVLLLLHLDVGLPGRRERDRHPGLPAGGYSGCGQGRALVLAGGGRRARDLRCPWTQDPQQDRARRPPDRGRHPRHRGAAQAASARHCLSWPVVIRRRSVPSRRDARGPRESSQRLR